MVDVLVLPGVTRTLLSMEGSAMGLVGKLMAGTEARVEDPDTRQLVEVGQPGEMVVRGPQVAAVTALQVFMSMSR